MKIRINKLCWLIIFAIALSSCSRIPTKNQHELIIKMNGPKKAIDPLMYGIFFEELDFAGDGGLYAELVRNTSFEKEMKTQYWNLLEQTAKGSFILDSINMLNDIQKKCARLTITETNINGRVAIANEGYWGIPIEKDTTYTLSFFARCSADFSGQVTVSLEDSIYKTAYALSEVTGIDHNWRKFSVQLTAANNNTNARLVLSAKSLGTVWFDVISLFPPTYKNRPNGMRPDLMKKLVDLKPAFMRFPGGCYVQGYDNIDQAFNWKKSIGPLEEREGMYIMWSYYASAGMGYHEMLQLAEDIGAEPIYVFNVGQTMNESVPDDQIQYWVDMALDAIEYANGSIQTKWGKKRAENGHPEPFNMKIVGVGNEDAVPKFADEYEKHYSIFSKAIKAKYPNIKLIQSVNHLTDNPQWNGLPADYVDHHYYRSPAWFFNNQNKFDDYSRNEPKVFISELASLSNDVGEGNLWGAIGEAAFMTGLEKNSDVVTMSCYAPLFRNIHWRNWNPNMILFDNHQSIGIPSYYLWQMFMHNTGNIYIPSHISNNIDTVYPNLLGYVGVSTWRTKAEFDNLKVTFNDKTYEQNFSGNLNNWVSGKGEWNIENEKLNQSSLEEGCETIWQQIIDQDNYSISLRARKLNGDEGFQVVFGKTESQSYTWNIGGWGNTRSCLMCNSSTQSGEIGRSVNHSVETGRWYNLRVDVENGNHIKCYIDNDLQLDYILQPRSSNSLFASVNQFTESNDIVIKLVNTTNQEHSLKLNFDSINFSEYNCSDLVLTSPSQMDENSFDNPTKVSPVPHDLGILTNNFTYNLSPYSISIIRMKKSQ